MILCFGLLLAGREWDGSGWTYSNTWLYFLLLAFGIGLLVRTMGRLEWRTYELPLLDGFVHRNAMHWPHRP